MKTCRTYRVTLIICGLLIMYVLQMAPSPMLSLLQAHFRLNNDILLNLSVNSVFPFIIAGCFAGGKISRQKGIKYLYSCCLLLGVIGCLLGLTAPDNYYVLLIGRTVFGFGFGLGIPFIGSAIMQWFEPCQRDAMETVNAMFPFAGTWICFAAMVPICELFGGRWQWCLAVWGLLLLIIWALWVRCPISEEESRLENEEKTGSFKEYGALLRRKELLLINTTFFFGFFVYSYLCVIFPIYFLEMGKMEPSLSNLLVATAFPVTGCFGTVIGGLLTAKTARRRPIMLLGFAGEVLGILILLLGSTQRAAFIIVGMAVYGFSNGFWLPALYCVPIDLKGMTPQKAGKAFSVLTVCGMTAGIFAPSIGGGITMRIAETVHTGDMVAKHAFGLKWSTAVFLVFDVIAIILLMVLPETGKRKA